MDLTGGYLGTLISAKFNIMQKWASTCSPGSNAKVWLTTGITSSTTWNTQPYWHPGLVAETPGNRRIDSAYGCGGSGWAEFDVTPLAQNEIWNQAPQVNLGLRAIDESTMNQWKRFDHTTAQLVLVYNNSPNPPAAQPLSSTADCYLVCTSTTAASTVSTQAQGWWRLDETGGTTAVDSSGSGHTATSSGGVSWVDGGASFNGTGDLRTSAAVLDTAKHVAVSAWAKISDTAGFYAVASQHASQAGGFWLGYDMSLNRWAFTGYSADVTNASPTAAASATAPAVGAWTHLVGVRDVAANTLTLYVNGAWQATVAAPAAFASTGPLAIGGYQYNGVPGPYFKGGVDNVQTYQRLLGQADVTTLYNAGRAGGAINISPAVSRNLTPTLSFQVSDPDANSQLWSDLDVRTAPSETATVVHSAGGLGSGAQSGTTVPYPMPAGKFVNGGTYYWRARSVDELGWFGAWSAFHAITIDTTAPATATAVSTQYPQSQWGALVGTAGTFTLSDTSSDTAEFEWWIDGGSHTITNAVGTSPRTASVSYTPPTGMGHTLSVKAKDKAGNISATYVYQFFVTPGVDRFSHWALDETAGTTAADSGNGQTVGGVLSPATLSGTGLSFGPGHVGGSNGLVFTGNAQAATSGPVLDTTKAFTVMAWVNPSDLSADRVIVSQDGTNSSRFLLHFDKDANSGAGGWCFSMRATDGAVPVDACADGSLIPATVGSWVHLAGVYDPANPDGKQLRVYVMGDPESCFDPLPEAASASFSGSWTATGAFVIGRGRSGGADSNYWRGSVDDVYAHQKVLTGQQICQQAQP